MASNSKQPVTQDQLQQLTSRFNKIEKWTKWKVQGNDPSTNYGLSQLILQPPIAPSGNPNPKYLLWVLQSLIFNNNNMLSPETDFFGSILTSNNFDSIPSSVTTISLDDTYSINNSFHGITLSVALSAARAYLNNNDFSNITTPLLTLDGAYVLSCNFQNCAIQDVNARSAVFISTDFNPVDFVAGDFTGSSFYLVSFAGATLSGILFTYTQQIQSNLASCTGHNCDFTDSKFKGATLANSDWTGTTFINCDFYNSTFAGATVANCDFTGASNMQGTSIDTATGVDTAIFSGPIGPLQANVQTGNYSIVLPLDIGQPLIFDLTGAATCTLPAAFNASCSLYYNITNQSSSTANLTIDPNGFAINGVVTPITLTPGQSVILTWSTTNTSFYTNQ